MFQKLPSLVFISSLLSLLTISFLPAAAQDENQIHEIARLGRGTANALAWRPDGAVLAVGSGTGIWFYDENFETLGYFADEATGIVTSVSWSPDGQSLAAANENDNTQIWQISSDVLSAEVSLNIEATGSLVTWQPNGNKLISTDFENDNLYIWDTDTGDRLLTVSNIAVDAAWSPDGSRFAAQTQEDDERIIGIWDATTGERLMTLQGFASGLYWGDIAWSPDGKRLAGVTVVPGSVHVWDVESGQLVNTPDTSADFAAFVEVVWNADGSKLFVDGRPVTPPVYGYIDMYDTATWEREVSNGTREGIETFALHLTNNTLFVVTSDSSIYKFDALTLEQTGHYILHNPPQSQIIWSNDNSRLVSVYGDETPGFLWDVSEPINLPIVLDGLRFRRPTLGLWDADDSFITIGFDFSDTTDYFRYYVQRWDGLTGEEIETLFYIDYGDIPLAWSPDYSRYAVSTDKQDAVEIRDTENNRLLVIPAEHVSIYAAWSPNGSLLATTSLKNEASVISLQIWDISTGELVSAYEIVEQDYVSYLSWSPDSKKVIFRTTNSELQESLINVFDITTNAISLTWENDLITPVAWRPDSHYLAIFLGRNLQFWNIQNLELTYSFSFSGERIRALA